MVRLDPSSASARIWGLAFALERANVTKVDGANGPTRNEEMSEDAREKLRSQAEQLDAAARRLPQQLGRDELLKDIVEFIAKLNTPQQN